MESLPDNDKCRNFGVYDAIKYLSDVINLLEESKIVDKNYNIYELFLRISTSFYDYYHKFIDKVCDEYKKRNLVDLINCFLQNQNILSHKKDDTLHLMYLILANFSEHDVEFAQKLETSNCIKYVVDEYLRNNISDVETCKKNRIFKDLITIIHNFSSYNFNKIYKIEEIKVTCLKINQLNCDDYFGIISLLILSYLVEDEEVCLLSKCANIVHKLMEKIKFTSENKMRSDGFTLKELIHGLRRISANEEMKKIIDKDGGIPILINILKTHKDKEQVIEPTLDTIKQLCFNEDIKMKLINYYKIEEVLMPFSEQSNVKIIQHYEGILWQLKNKWESIHKRNTKKSFSYFDVFISYCWANKEKVLEICNKLKSYDIRVWIDEEEMNGSSLEAMATGIESSRLVIIAISSAYKNSSNCRLEAEYAFKINKPIIPMVMEYKYKPKNWLGLLIGVKVYFEFSERRNAEEQVKKLKNSIELHLNRPRETCENVEKNKDKSHYKKNVAMSRNVLQESVKKWTCENVAVWLDKYQIGYLKEKFIDVNGLMIEVMLDIRSNSSDYFNNCLKNEYGMNFVEVVKFHKALNDLLIF